MKSSDLFSPLSKLEILCRYRSRIDPVFDTACNSPSIHYVDKFDLMAFIRLFITIGTNVGRGGVVECCIVKYTNKVAVIEWYQQITGYNDATAALDYILSSAGEILSISIPNKMVECLEYIIKQIDITPITERVDIIKLTRQFLAMNTMNYSLRNAIELQRVHGITFEGFADYLIHDDRHVENIRRLISTPAGSRVSLSANRHRPMTIIMDDPI